ncbi:sodium-independent anion transporter [Thioclava sediminum]|uniref:Sodium-independent anion transporter n=1 Tax=Thioclava sediminum TaxID=1915319 RepID=A0ABX3MVV8_9RHOB|nr:MULTISPECIES: sulfate permease [Thioclava]MPQ93823.1 sulfate permease [Thioclava sp. JE_KL1]OOY23507.1 sodium-independent anion transporter [Thioclava sediminum]OOY30676.1 sodium-independent anion transporter [Thioclava sp. F36-6]
MLKRYLPILSWGRDYDRPTFEADLIAAVIVTIMLIPQSLAYSLLAGMPPEYGLYASVLPLLIYAVFGTSRPLAVGPVAVISLMTAAAVGKVAAQGTPEYIAAAVALAFLSGVMLVIMGFLRMGFITAFLSHPVLSGFTSAVGILIAAGQMKHFFGIQGESGGIFDILGGLWAHLGQTNGYTVVISILSLVFLFWARRGLKPRLLKAGLSERLAAILTRAAPVYAVAATILITWLFGLEGRGVRVVGTVPLGFPTPSLPPADLALWKELFVPALLIAIIGYVETISVAQTLAAKKRQRIDPDQEFIALGGASIGSAISGSFPITGGFARSVVSFEAGATTPAAGAFTAIGVALATFTLTPALYYLPQATLAATIFVSVLTLVDTKALKRTFKYAPREGIGMALTVLVTLIWGVEDGIAFGVILSIALRLWASSRPHVAELGQVPGTEHFRNVQRHRVSCAPGILSLRIDESLWFPNARFVEEMIYDRIASDESIKHVVLNCPAINHIDMSALEALEEVNDQLNDAGVRLHLSEVKGPVMDRLTRSDLITHLTGQIYLTHYDALATLAPETTQGCAHESRIETHR